MRTLKVTVAYDGTGYAGWQRQNGAPTIQALLEAAFNEIEGRAVTVRGAARTDAGVHALGQVASARLTHSIDNAALARALNAKLPDDIRILRVDAVADDFHAQYAARSKAYQYRLSLGPVANPPGTGPRLARASAARSWEDAAGWSGPLRAARLRRVSDRCWRHGNHLDRTNDRRARGRTPPWSSLAGYIHVQDHDGRRRRGRVPPSHGPGDRGNARGSGGGSVRGGGRCGRAVVRSSRACGTDRTATWAVPSQGRLLIPRWT